MPRPRKSSKETWKDYHKRLTTHYIKEGYPPGQAYKIAESIIDKKRKGK